MTPPTLEAKELTKSFGGVVAAADVSFALQPAEMLALIGPNGAGKSTVFNMLGGQLRPDRGRVEIAGEDVTGKPARARFRLGVGRTFQIAAAFSSMRVVENVQIAIASARGRAWSLIGSARAAFRDEAMAILARVGVAEAAERACAVLAYGDLKRVELAIALANRPKLLLMDEPTAGMAPAERGALMDLVASVAREEGLSVLFTEHDMDVVFGHAARVLVLNEGRLIAEGTPDAIRDNDQVRAIYLGRRADAR